ncbi:MULTISPECIES: glutamate-1-semialdehyde 2,1-aminomutase [Desulfovibrio]|uniref:Glutamate-1-semialdehyde 2,1-aminomutase n=3 Tax=Desulfovibrio TaxID=872 RepID=GSA_DESDA|nr:MULTISPECIES: glutamate-1-semialdehyde 2,1-aminomutase [Desulfovibrio]B8J3A3.1 RecName: Full=Glutamate-1-semialdehyde 2,1-aminomutase; Short=GSA; AltName: Full=Glutamate-1-semialdehyde aminotransferase; Short=GSA-AT [Desulfovibrio desulfuricans ATCC 27774]ATD80339.1 glutamate-1-semialdehyde 2,1-aminomutase [Desulfovibrio sp. G11]MDY0203005.1 glutamate-1-semialdehyde 2,1-aminomutase [Desulfovibrio desulfuricans]SFW12254.1 glutamate-1-semialdehyde 2,1-aminomutase [Desulfovibrio desulfuricans]
MDTVSRQLFEKAQAVIPGGVNSPVRACHNVDSQPLFIAEAHGCHLTDVDGRQYIDFVLSWGPMILGHDEPSVTRAVCDAAHRGTSYGAPCPDEVLLAEAVVAAMPSLEMVRMVNSGTEATMSALRLARAATRRDKVLKFVGCYHGHADPFLAAAGSGLATFSIPGTPGVPAAVVADTLLAPYNDLEAVKECFARHGESIAAIIVEPVAANMGLVLPKPGFLEGLRAICDQYESLLIFDEVITGFRAAFGGAQARFKVDPDLTTFGKIIGGGLPVGAFGGKRRYMELIAPRGGVYQAGTLSGNPLAMAAGLATLGILRKADYDGLENRTRAFAYSMRDIIAAKGVPLQMPTLASMFCPYFSEHEVTDFADAQKCDQKLFTSFYKQMRAQGIYLAPSGYETGMVSFAHTDEDFNRALDAARKVMF